MSVAEQLTAQRIQRHSSHEHTIDFGINVAGVPRLRAQATEGTKLTMWPGELLDNAGRVTQWSTGTPIFHSVQIDEGAIDWTPRFGFNGYRYLDVQGDIPDSAVWTTDVLRASNRKVGTFRSSDVRLTRLHELVDRAIQGNMHSVFTDCPHREKLGWLEQLHLCFGALTRNYDVEAHLRDCLHHIRVAQLPSGALPNIAPELVDFSGLEFRGDTNAFREDPNWGGALVRMAWAHYRCYGDRRVLDENIHTIDRYLVYLAGRSKHGTLDFGLGDWVGLEHNTSREIVATHGWIGILRDAAQVHRVLGDQSRAVSLIEQADGVVRSLLSRHALSSDSTQAEIVLLADLDKAESTRYLAALEARLEQDAHVTVGEVALPAFIRLFTQTDRDRRLLELLMDPELPGYGYQVASDATALTETWTMKGGDEGEGSQNHFMLGMIDDWLRETIAGLRQADNDIRWRNAVIEPRMEAGPSAAETHFASPQGLYSVAWDTAIGRVDITIPVGGSAELRLPADWHAPSRVGAGQHEFFRRP
ncbi:family 78 glycoside hydrolase catalytic domain [Microbacterium sp. KSW4-11]|uniref:alpha-L-rhamnosidase n=1 Tax=Microbacterium gawkjiense TaxID=3067309 RepID=A0ABU3GEA6_9MICO|nr:family 78 glycoside hydrolase catalytic domain [Microbacterium sp. KSW4-11]MDT3318134.1 family 78 glycoside hydrolase catalytic domain [Microbacterium sp. KSW4-11]